MAASLICSFTHPGYCAPSSACESCRYGRGTMLSSYDRKSTDALVPCHQLDRLFDHHRPPLLDCIGKTTQLRTDPRMCYWPDRKKKKCAGRNCKRCWRPQLRWLLFTRLPAANKTSIPLASLGVIILSLAPVTQSRAQLEPQVCASAYVMALNGRGDLP